MGGTWTWYDTPPWLQHDLSHASSEADGHRRKRAAVNPAELQQALSTLVGRPLDEAEMSKLFPSFPESIDLAGAPLMHLTPPLACEMPRLRSYTGHPTASTCRVCPSCTCNLFSSGM